MSNSNTGKGSSGNTTNTGKNEASPPATEPETVPATEKAKPDKKKTAGNP